MSSLSISKTGKPGRILAALLMASAVTSAWAWQAGRMTGGGSIICPSPAYRVTFGFELHCQLDDGTISAPNNLEVNFSTGEHFHLTNLTSAKCSPPSASTPNAPFSTLTGEGTGTLNGQAATISFVLVDNGEPGSRDTASFTIYRNGQKVLDCGTCNLEGGNIQAHRATGNKP